MSGVSRCAGVSVSVWARAREFGCGALLRRYRLGCWELWRFRYCWLSALVCHGFVCARLGARSCSTCLLGLLR